MRRRSLSILLATASLMGACATTPAASRSDVKILLGEPTTLDPAAAGDAGSAAFIAQLYETVTAFDDDRRLQPALAESWRIEADGRRVVFHIRPDLTFSDGSPLVAADVVRSWRRLIDRGAPSPLVTLLFDIVGAREYLSGLGTLDDVGIRSDDVANDVVVDLIRPAADFPTIAASPSFGVVPKGILDPPVSIRAGDDFVSSGGYRLTAAAATSMTLQANDRYWAGPPAITTVTVVTDLGGRSDVEAFQDGEVDYAPIGGFDASWIAYVRDLGPQLREVESLSTDYYGFNATTPPFDDVRVRQAFAAAVDWRRIGRLALDDPSAIATSMVPPGIPGRSDRDVLPVHDPDQARVLLAEAGFPGGAGFPDVTILSGGSPYDEAVIVELKRELGVTVRAEVMDFGAYFTRLDADSPQMWFLSWVADYPGRNDFLGVLLGTGSANNYGRWSSPDFDAAIDAAGSAADVAAANAAFDRAEDVVQRDAPVIPVSYGTGWALARDGLLGAGQNGLGSLRMAGLAWAE
ncbi:MAG: peptide ABC transporter substrate-binding protein [Candidatus Limnocylindrales bacterium]